MDNSKEWRLMFGLGGILPAVMIILVCTVMPETPRWLVAKGRHDEAKACLERIYPGGYNVDVVVDDIQKSIQKEESAEKAVGWGEICRPTPAVRRMLLVGVGVAVAQQAVGIDAIQYYLLDILTQSGIDNDREEYVVLVMMGVLKLVFILIGGKLFDKRGRRPLFFISLLGMAVALLVVSLSFYISTQFSKFFISVALASYLAFFSIGMGPGAWLIPSEVFATCIRAKAMSVATTMNRVTSTIMSSSFLSTANAMGWGSFFLMLSVICIIVFAFVYRYLPETLGLSLENMIDYFAELTNDNFVLEAEAKINEGRRDSEVELVENDTPMAEMPEII